MVSLKWHPIDLNLRVPISYSCTNHIDIPISFIVLETFSFSVFSGGRQYRISSIITRWTRWSGFARPTGVIRAGNPDLFPTQSHSLQGLQSDSPSNFLLSVSFASRFNLAANSLLNITNIHKPFSTLKVITGRT